MILNFILVSIALAIQTIYLLRLNAILPICRSDKLTTPAARAKSNPLRPWWVFVYLGSGGHTGEMIRLLMKYSDTLLAAGNTIHVGYSDGDSLVKFRNNIASVSPQCIFEYHQFKKAREVNAGTISSIVSILQTLATSLWIIVKVRWNMLGRDHLVLLNGPGTCVIISFWFKFIEWLTLIIASSNIIYVESLARIETLSLTGKILYYLADEFVVQWEQLRNTKAHRAKCYGIIV